MPTTIASSSCHGPTTGLPRWESLFRAGQERLRSRRSFGDCKEASRFLENRTKKAQPNAMWKTPSKQQASAPRDLRGNPRRLKLGEREKQERDERYEARELKQCTFRPRTDWSTTKRSSNKNNKGSSSHNNHPIGKSMSTKSQSVRSRRLAARRAQAKDEEDDVANKSVDTALETSSESSSRSGSRKTMERLMDASIIAASPEKKAATSDNNATQHDRPAPTAVPKSPAKDTTPSEEPSPPAAMDPEPSPASSRNPPTTTTTTTTAAAPEEPAAAAAASQHTPEWMHKFQQIGQKSELEESLVATGAGDSIKTSPPKPPSPPARASSSPQKPQPQQQPEWMTKFRQIGQKTELEESLVAQGSGRRNEEAPQ